MLSTEKLAKIDQKKFKKWLNANSAFNEASLREGAEAVNRNREPLRKKIKELAEKHDEVAAYIKDIESFVEEWSEKIKGIETGVVSYREMREWTENIHQSKFSTEKYIAVANLLSRHDIKENIDYDILEKFYENKKTGIINQQISPFGVESITMLPFAPVFAQVIPVNPPSSEFSSTSQALKEPLRICTSSPFSPAADFVESGHALSALVPIVSTNSRSGSFTSICTGLVPGGGANGTAMVGVDVTWPSGFETVTIVADIAIAVADFTCFGIGVAWGGGSLRLTSSIVGGTTHMTELVFPITLVPILGGSTSSSSGSRRLSLTFPVSKTGGTMRINAGGHANAGAVLICGAVSAVAGSVTSICATFT